MPPSRPKQCRKQKPGGTGHRGPISFLKSDGTGGLCRACGKAAKHKGAKQHGANSSGNTTIGNTKRNAGAKSSGNTTIGKTRRNAGAKSSGNTTTGKTKQKAGVRSGLKRSTKSVLVVKDPWLDKILNGQKTWEVRGTNTTKRGVVHLALSGAHGRIVGRCHITDSFPVKKRALQKHFTKHRIKDLSVVAYRNPHAWVLSKSLRYSKPFVYTHKQVTIVWETL